MLKMYIKTLFIVYSQFLDSVLHFYSCLCYKLMQERDNKENELSKCKAELAALGVAAKQGVEAATKVKTLETDNKKLTDENKVLTENFNSERVGLNQENCSTLSLPTSPIGDLDTLPNPN